jgi:TolA-binding protein
MKASTEGVRLFEKGRLDSAFVYFNKLYAEHPQNLDILYYLAKSEANSKKSYEYFSKIITTNPEYPRAEDCHWEIGEFCYASARYKEAGRHYALLSDKYTASPMADVYLYKTAQANILAGQLEKANLILKRLLLDYPDSKHRMDAYLLRADIALKKGKVMKARESYEGLLNTPEYYKKSGVLYRLYKLENNEGSREKAEKYQKAIREKYPHSMEALTYFGPLDTAQPSGGKSSEKDTATADSVSDVPGYTIQFGAFSSENNAQKLVQSLIGKCRGLKVVKRVRSHRKLYLVWAQSFPTKAKAREYANSLYIDRNIRYVVVKELP